MTRCAGNWAATISTIIDREYVWKKGTALVPSFTAFAVVGLLEQHFPDLVDYAFTARMEDDLDAIASGERSGCPGSALLLRALRPGRGRLALKEKVDTARGDRRPGHQLHPPRRRRRRRAIVARAGKYGPYLARGEDTASIPEDIPPDELTVERALEILAQPKDGLVLGDDPDTGLPVLAKAGRFGPYVQLGELDARARTSPAPRRSSPP